jgi:hypothetical protein
LIIQNSYFIDDIDYRLTYSLNLGRTGKGEREVGGCGQQEWARKNPLKETKHFSPHAVGGPLFKGEHT